MRVLITSAGKKVNLVKAFQQAGAFVIASDTDYKAPALKEANFAVTDHLGLVIDFWVPTRDGEILAAATNFPNISITSSPDTIKTCIDKAEFYRFCRRHEFPVPYTGCYEALVKPRFGSAGKGQFLIDRSYIVQAYIRDIQEYSIDYFADFNGKTLSVIPRKRLMVVNGESQACEISEDAYLIKEATRLGQELDIRGPATLQCFYDGKKIAWIEVNPRFGGGTHFTWHIFSGPKWLVDNFHLRDGNETTPRSS